MPKKNLVIGISLALLMAGGILQIIGYQNLAGISIFGLALLGGMLYRELVLLNQRSSSMRRELDQSKQELTGIRNIIRWYGTQLLDYGNSTLKRVKIWDTDNFPAMSPRTSKDQAHRIHATSQEQPFPSKMSALRTGRAATPEVSNPMANENLSSILNPQRRIKVAGIFEESLVRNLPVDAVHWHPSTILDLLKQESPDLVIVDEASLDKRHWYGTYSASGTAQMSEIIEAISWCSQNSLPVYLMLNDSSSPEVNSLALRQAKVECLPLSEEAMRQSFGANLTPILERAQSIALKRKACK